MPLRPWRSTTLARPDGGELNVTAVPAQHGPDDTDDIVGPVLGFVHELASATELDARVEKFAGQLAAAGPQALARSKKLLAKIAKSPISPKIGTETAAVLAEVRAGTEAGEGIRSFLEKRKPSWNRG